MDILVTLKENQTDLEQQIDLYESVRSNCPEGSEMFHYCGGKLDALYETLDRFDDLIERVSLNG